MTVHCFSQTAGMHLLRVCSALCQMTKSHGRGKIAFDPDRKYPILHDTIQQSTNEAIISQRGHPEVMGTGECTGQEIVIRPPFGASWL